MPFPKYPSIGPGNPNAQPLVPGLGSAPAARLALAKLLAGVQGAGDPMGAILAGMGGGNPYDPKIPLKTAILGAGLAPRGPDPSKFDASEMPTQMFNPLEMRAGLRPGTPPPQEASEMPTQMNATQLDHPLRSPGGLTLAQMTKMGLIGGAAVGGASALQSAFPSQATSPAGQPPPFPQMPAAPPQFGMTGTSNGTASLMAMAKAMLGGNASDADVMKLISQIAATRQPMNEPPPTSGPSPMPGSNRIQNRGRNPLDDMQMRGGSPGR